MIALRWIAALFLATVGSAQAPINRSLLEAAAEEVAGEHWLVSPQRAVVHVGVEVQAEPPFVIERPGSGVVVSADGLVLTHLSLVREAIGASDKEVFVRLGTGVRAAAEVVARDAGTGMALLRMSDVAATAFSSVPLASARPGQAVAILGLHDGEDFVCTSGVLSAPAGDVEFGAEGETRRLERELLITTDAAIQERSHGAALLDRDGALVGLCDASRIARLTAEPTLAELKQPSYGFAISSAAIRRAFPELLRSELAPPRADPAADMIAGAAESVVAVYGGVLGERPPLGLRDPGAHRRREGVGSGIVVHGAGTILTNLHVVDGADRVWVRPVGGQWLEGVVRDTDRKSNSAMLEVELPEGDTLRAIPLGTVDAVAVGDPVWALGNPEGHGPTVSAGVVSAFRGSHVQVDARLGNHNGGGVLVNERGEMIALVDAGRRDAIDVAFAQRGDRAKLETGLHAAPSVDALRENYGTDALPSSVPAPVGGRGTTSELVEKTADSLLNLYIEVTTAAEELSDNPFAAPSGNTATESLGSAVIVDASGLVVSNWHVVDSATWPDGSMRADRVVRATTRGGRVFDVQVLSISREEDLALLRLVLEPGDVVEPIELGRSSSVRVGDPVLAVGNPHGLANTVTTGVVTAIGQSIRVQGRWAKLPHLLETDASINGGNSGGALLDRRGRLIGINSAGGPAHDATGFAISVDRVREVVRATLLSPEKMRSPYLGVKVRDLVEESAVEVALVDPVGPAAEAGIRPGDRLLSIDGEPVRWSVGYAMQRLELEAGRSVIVEIERGGSSERAEVTPWSAAARAVARQTGLEVEEVSGRDEPGLVRSAAVAALRHFSGDPTAVPRSIPDSMVRVVRSASAPSSAAAAEAGDLLVGVVLSAVRVQQGEDDRLVSFETTDDVQRCFGEYSSYEGEWFTALVYRDGAVRQILLRAVRLLP